MIPRRSFLYWANLDKWRPALVLSPDYRNEHASDLIVVPCSTKVRAAPTHVILRRGEGGVASASVLKCEQIATLPKSELRSAPLGRALSRERMQAVERAVLRAIGVPVPQE